MCFMVFTGVSLNSGLELGVEAKLFSRNVGDKEVDAEHTRMYSLRL